MTNINPCFFNTNDYVAQFFKNKKQKFEQASFDILQLGRQRKRERERDFNLAKATFLVLNRIFATQTQTLVTKSTLNAHFKVAQR